MAKLCFFLSVTMALSVISLNVNGLRNTSKCSAFVQWLHGLPVQVNVVFTTHCLSDVECNSWFSFCGFSFVFSPGTTRSGGCIVVCLPSLSLLDSSCDVLGSSIICTFSFHGSSFCVLCLYAPNHNPFRDLLQWYFSLSQPLCSHGSLWRFEHRIQLFYISLWICHR